MELGSKDNPGPGHGLEQDTAPVPVATEPRGYDINAGKERPDAARPGMAWEP
jgi:hypothetical protein